MTRPTHPLFLAYKPARAIADAAGERERPAACRGPFSLLSQHSVRPKGLEPLTFWLVADQAERIRYEDRFWSIVCQEFPDTESAYLAAVA